jgi:GAF domain-containing protein
VGDDGLARAVQAMASLLVAEAPLAELSWRVAVAARDAWPPVDAVGLTLVDDRGRPGESIVTDEVAAAVDGAQYRSGAGPCPEALRTATVVRVDDTLVTPSAWRAFRTAAVLAGVRSALAVPLVTRQGVLGALSFYAHAPRALGPAVVEDVPTLAAQAAVVLANARAYWASADRACGLAQAMASRAVIEQAKGKIMAIRGCGEAEAFAILSRASQRENVKVRDLARRMVEAPGHAVAEVAHGDDA